MTQEEFNDWYVDQLWIPEWSASSQYRTILELIKVGGQTDPDYLYDLYLAIGGPTEDLQHIKECIKYRCAMQAGLVDFVEPQETEEEVDPRRYKRVV